MEGGSAAAQAAAAAGGTAANGGRGGAEAPLVGLGALPAGGAGGATGAAAAHEQDTDGVGEFMAALDEYVPVIPDELTNHCLARAGVKCDDVIVTRLVSLAAQKFVSDIVADAVALCKSRTSAGISKGRSAAAVAARAEKPKINLTIDDLSSALKEYGVRVRRPEFYVARPTADAAAAAACGGLPAKGAGSKK